MPTHIEITRAGALAAAGSMPIESGLVASQTITPLGTNLATDFSTVTTAIANGDPLFVTITADENIFVSVKASPNALTDNPRRAMAAGSTRSFAWSVGQNVAVVTR